MAELTPTFLLEYRGRPPVRQFRAGAPRSGRVLCTRLEYAGCPQGVPDSLGDYGHTVVTLVTESGRELLPRPIVCHSPTGFEWGYGGSGPADLAANVLAVILPLREAWRLHQSYKEFAIAPLDRDGGELSIRAARLWVEAQWSVEQIPDIPKRKAGP